jgi:hypothetical protein
MHMPVVALICTLVVAPGAGSRLTVFVLTVLLAVPLCLVTARMFAAVFEKPFMPASPRVVLAVPPLSGLWRPGSRRRRVGA